MFGANIDQNLPMPPRRYTCHRLSSPIVIDGRLDKSQWQEVQWSEEFVDIKGDSMPTPPLRTRVKMLWDDEFIYVGAELEEPHVWATLIEKNSVIFQDNDFEIFIDPDGDTLRYYEFEINAAGTIWELMLPRPYRFGGVPVTPWNRPGLKSAVFIDGTLNNALSGSKGWSVEVAIPFADLRELATSGCPPKPGDEWRMNFSRVEWDHEIIDDRFEKIEGTEEHNWVWSPQGVIDMHRPEMWGIVEFSG